MTNTNLVLQSETPRIALTHLTHVEKVFFRAPRAKAMVHRSGFITRDKDYVLIPGVNGANSHFVHMLPH